jgi:WD repeat-containing protein 35
MYHFNQFIYFMATTLLPGDFNAAMKTAIKLCEYDDLIRGQEIYALISLLSLRNRYYGVCSKAFVKLETLVDTTEEYRDAIQILTMKIFSQNNPQDPSELHDDYIKCMMVGKSYKACILTGAAVRDEKTIMCQTCRQLMIEEHLPRSQQCCPLCHSSMTKK